MDFEGYNCNIHESKYALIDEPQSNPQRGYYGNCVKKVGSILI